jgi:hypothetical protein
MDDEIDEPDDETTTDADPADADPADARNGDPADDPASESADRRDG